MWTGFISLKIESSVGLLLLCIGSEQTNDIGDRRSYDFRK